MTNTPASVQTLEFRQPDGTWAQPDSALDKARRFVTTAVLVLPFTAVAAFAQTGTDAITQDTATSVATKMLTYLGYAIAAGLTVLVAVLGAQAAWKFFARFIKA